MILLLKGKKFNMQLKKIIFLLTIAFNIFFLVIAEEESSSYGQTTIDQPAPLDQYNQFLKDLEARDIDYGIFSGCNAGCSYNQQTGEINLVPGAKINDLSSSRLTINLNGGTAVISGVEFEGTGKITGGNPPQISGGNVHFDKLNNNINLNFVNAGLASNKEQWGISGQGRIINGIIYLDDCQLTHGGTTHNVQNAQLKFFGTQGINKGWSVLIAREGFRVGDSKNYIGIDPGRTLALYKSKKGVTEIKVIDQQRITYKYFRKQDEQGNEVGPNLGTRIELTTDNKESSLIPNIPTFRIQGKPTAKIADHSGIYSTIPLKIEMNGQEHLFLGDVLFKKGQMMFPASEKIHMIDGVYVIPYSRVNVFFDDKKHKDNYIALGQKLHLAGDNFKVGLSENGKGKLDDDFNIPMIGNRYAIKKESDLSPFRLIIDLNGKPIKKNSEVIIDPQNKNIDVKGIVNIRNGPSIINFYTLKNKQKFTLGYSGCMGLGESSAEGGSCTELPYTVTTKLNTGYKVSFFKQESDVKLETGTSTLTLPLGKYGNLGDYNVELDKAKIYALGYKGGSAAETLVGKEFAKQEWGHAGILFHKDKQWWVAEADGVSVKIIPFDQSLFGVQKLHGLFQINNYDGTILTPQQIHKGIGTIERLAGAPYDLNPLTSQKIHCSDVVARCVQGATGKDFQGRVTFKDIPEIDPVTAAQGELAGPHFITPNYALNSPNLQPIITVGAKGDINTVTIHKPEIVKPSPQKIVKN